MATNSSFSEKDFKELKSQYQELLDSDSLEEQTDSSLRRFLEAFQTPENAIIALKKCHKWRQEFGVDNIKPDNEDIQKEMITGKALLLRQRDIAGRPIVYIAARKHITADSEPDRMTRFTVYLLENACKRCNEDVIDNLCIVFDLKDFAMSNMDYQFVKNLIWLLSKYFPERLGTCLIINSPMLFTGCWTVIKPWLNEKTANKVQFVNNDEELGKYVHPDMLPTE